MNMHMHMHMNMNMLLSWYPGFFFEVEYLREMRERIEKCIPPKEN